MILLIPFGIVCIIYLIILSYLDYKYQEVENSYVYVMLFAGLVFAQLSNNLASTLVFMLFTLILGVFLWYKGAIGGADAKLLPCVIPFLGLSGLPNTLVGGFFFIVLFGIIGAMYGLVGKFIVKSDKIPFIPAITLTYIIFMFYRINWF